MKSPASISLALALAVALGAPAARAQANYPSQPIRIVVPFQPGTAPDTTTRFLGQRLAEILKQPVVVDNKPGAGGAIGAGALAKATPDGYTLGYLSNQHLLHPYILKKLPYDPVRDFRSVALLGQSPQMLIVPVTSKAETVAEFVASAKARNVALNYGSGGIGSPAHLAGLVFARQAQLPAIHIPYKGSPESLSALMGGQIDYIITTAATAAPLLKVGKVKALAITSAQRNPAFPALPTLAEALPGGLVYEPWGLLAAPARTPQAIVDKLSMAINQVLAEPRTVDFFSSFGSRVNVNSAKEARIFYLSEAASLAIWVRDYQLQFD